MTENLTLDSFARVTGFRFRVTREQKALIADGQLTRDQAFTQFIEGGGLERLQGRPGSIPNSVYLDADLTLDNFSEKVEAAIGTPRRFRVSREQYARIEAGSLTREQALAEVVAAKRITETPTQEPVLATGN